MKINYDMMQLRRAAQFIFEHNKLFVKSNKCETREDVEKNIIEHIELYASATKIVTYAATGGWLLLFSENENGDCDCEIYVDPSVCEESFYTTIGESK